MRPGAGQQPEQRHRREATLTDTYTSIQKLDYVRQRLGEIGFWFVDIPRTSSTALRIAFYRKYGKLFGKPSNSQGLGAGLIPPHVPARLAANQLGGDLWNGLYTFSIVRNPFERLLSLYQFLRNNGKLQNLSFPEYVRRLSTGQGFEYHGHSMSNLGYLTDEQGRVIVRDIFRFEDRARAMERIAEQTACPELLQEDRKVYETSRRHYSSYYDDATVERVAKLFREDLEYFGYSFERAQG